MADLLSFLSEDPSRLKALTSAVDVVLKLILAFIGFYLAHSISRHVSLRVSEKRLEAYATLWAATQGGSPTRLEDGGEGPLTSQERMDIHSKLMNWYYEGGNGLLLAGGTRTMYLTAMHNLIRPVTLLQPKSFRAEVQEAEEEAVEKIRGERSIRQLSMLRTRMKADLRVFGIHYGGGITESDKAFLRGCGQNLWKKPWRKIF